MQKTSPLGHSIRIGTLVNGLDKDPARYIRQILPHGFESFSINFWQTLGKVNLKELSKRVNAELAGSGATISALGMFGNPLGTSPIDKKTIDGWKKVIDHAHLFGTDLVAGFTGRVTGKPIPESIPRFKKVFSELAKHAKDQGVRICFENCSMGGTWQTGDWNIAHNPDAWKLMFDAVPSKNVGLEWEPCHQMVQLIDPMPQLKEWTPRIFHLHGKDATIHWDLVKKHGVFGNQWFAYHRTPGFGDSNWADIISELRRHGFQGSIDIEGWHDPVYCGKLEMTGQVHALNYLKQCRGGHFVENPK